METSELKKMTMVTERAIVGTKCYTVAADGETYTIWDGTQWIGSYRDYQGQLERVDPMKDFLNEVERVGFE